MAESPDISPDGRRRVRRGCATPSADIFTLDIDSGEIKNITDDAFGDYGPTWAPDGKSIFYMARVSGNDKLFRIDLADAARRHSSPSARTTTAPRSSRPRHARVPVDRGGPEPADQPRDRENGNIYNVWTLNLKTNELKQYTDALGGNVSPVVLRDENKAQKIAFITYYKGEYGIHTVPAQKEAAPHRGDRRLRRARPDHRLPAAAEPHAGQGQPKRQGALREAVPRGTAAGQRRRHQRRRLLRRHAGDLSPTCSATSSSTSTPSRSRSTARCRVAYLNLSRRFQYALQGSRRRSSYYAERPGTYYAAASTAS
jgi:hypothetical protein